MTSVFTRRLAAVAAAVLVLGGLAAAPARAATDKPAWTSDRPEDGSNAAAELMAAQEPLVDLATRITALDPDGKGLGGIRLRVTEHALDLWWKGDVPGEVRDEVARAAEGGVTVELGESRYSQRELVDATEAVPARWKDFPGLVDVSPAVDGSGLVVGVTGDADPAGWDFGVPATVVRSEQVRQTSRQNDFAPWWGGAALRMPSGNCSTGFAVIRRTLWWESSRGILTAEHCAPGGGVRVTDPTGELVGVAEPAPARRLSDSLYVPTRSANRIYDGGVGVGEFSKPVVGAVGNFPGQFVCTSGAFTGVHQHRDHPDQRVVPALRRLVRQQRRARHPDRRPGGGRRRGQRRPGLHPHRRLHPDPGGRADRRRARPGELRRVRSGCFNQVAFVDIGFVLLAQDAQILTS